MAKGACIVSEYWLRKSLAQSTVLAPNGHALYRPVAHVLPIRGADHCRLCFSGIHGEDKCLAEWLASQVCFHVILVTLRHILGQIAVLGSARTPGLAAY